MPRLGGQLCGNGGGTGGGRGIGQQLGIDFADGNLPPPGAKPRTAAGLRLGMGALGGRGSGQTRKDVARGMRVAPQQRVETIQTEHADAGKVLQKIGQLVRQDRLRRGGVAGKAGQQGFARGQEGLGAKGVAGGIHRGAPVLFMNRR